MKRLELITANKLWKDAIFDIREAETERIFCKHSVEHLVDVARIAYIENLEKNLGLDKELIYASALLHDIGRSPKFSKGLPHEEAGALMAREILAGADFSETEISIVVDAILAHRDADTGNFEGLKGLLYRADKKSRLCLFCDAKMECNWSETKMNLKIDI